jgi:deoxyadenosine/deoxycytidine kinase
MNKDFKISIEGNIGSGKTTLIQNFKEKIKMNAFVELQRIEEWTLMKEYYDNLNDSNRDKKKCNQLNFHLQKQIGDSYLNAYKNYDNNKEINLGKGLIKNHINKVSSESMNQSNTTVLFKNKNAIIKLIENFMNIERLLKVLEQYDNFCNFMFMKNNITIEDLHEYKNQSNEYHNLPKTTFGLKKSNNKVRWLSKLKSNNENSDKTFTFKNVTMDNKNGNESKLVLFEGIYSSNEVFTKIEFNKGLLQENHYRELTKKYNFIKNKIYCDLIVYLNPSDNISTCMKRIEERDRNSEKSSITKHYLSCLDHAYAEFLLNASNYFPIIYIDNLKMGVDSSCFILKDIIECFY